MTHHLALASKALSAVPRALLCKMPIFFLPGYTNSPSEQDPSPKLGFCCSLCQECHLPHLGLFKSHLSLKSHWSASCSSADGIETWLHHLPAV